MFKEGQYYRLLGCSFALWWLVSAAPLYAKLGVTLLTKSTSGKTVILNKGRLDGIAEREIGVLLKKVTFGGELKAVPVGNIQLVKVIDNYSTWHIEEFFHPELLIEGDNYHLLTYAESMRARRPMKIKRRRLIQHHNKEDQAVENLQTNENPDLAKINDVAVEKVIGDHGSEMNHDVELVDLSEWRARKVQARLYHDDLEKVYPVEIYRSPYKKEFQKRIDRQTFEKLVANHTQKVNDPSFLKELQQKEKTVSALNTYLQHQKEVRLELDRRERYYQNVTGPDGRWSEGLSDTELSRTLQGLGEFSEDKRVHSIIQRLSRHQVKFGLGMNMVDNAPSGRAGNNAAFSLAWEYLWGAKYSLMSKLSSELAIRRSSDSGSSQGRAISIQEDSIEFGMNWYPVHYPDQLHTYLYYMGLKLRYGVAQIEDIDDGLALSYSLSAQPVFQTGIKYLFNDDFGIQAQMQYARNEFKRVERKDDTEPLGDIIAQTDLRFDIALALRF